MGDDFVSSVLSMKKSLLFCAALLASTVAFAGDKGSKPAHIAFGEKITLEDHLVKGKTTVVDFTSKFCPPCVAISPKLDELHAKRDDVAVVKVDINRKDVRGIDWKSPVAQQFQLESIPHFLVYGPDGKLIASGNEARAIVMKML